MSSFKLETDRLILRVCRDEDLACFAEMSADPRVMATLGPVRTRDQAAETIRWCQAMQRDVGHSFWAVERQADGAFLGLCGVLPGDIGPITGKIEIGWRLAHDHWGQGYAREAASAALEWGFANLAHDRIWAITTPGNRRSWGLMERLGMVRHPELDFLNPKLPEGDPLKPHITYSIGRDQWTAFRSSR